MGGFLPVHGQIIYCATKAAVKLLTEGLNSELRNTNVKVTVVFPGAIHTNIMGNSGLVTDHKQPTKAQLSRLITPIKSADIIIEAIESDCYRVLVGSDSKFSDLFYRLKARRAVVFISKKMKRI